MYAIEDDGKLLDANIELNGSDIRLHSRSGKRGAPGARNSDYSPALRALLLRLDAAEIEILDAYVDSAGVQSLPLAARRILEAADAAKRPLELFSLFSQRMRLVGRSDGRPGGNNNKLIRICTSAASEVLISRLSLTEPGSLRDGTAYVSIQPAEPVDDVEQIWAEGERHLVSHFRRERASGLSRAKKAAFREMHDGRLYCEACGIEPEKAYGSALAEACIEAHHATTKVAEMGPDHITKLGDLLCLCANCHRLEHAKMRLERARLL